MPRSPGWRAGFLCFCPATGRRDSVVVSCSIRRVSCRRLLLPPARLFPASPPTAYAVGCILTPLPRLVDSRILQILVLCTHFSADFDQKNSRVGVKSRKQRAGNFLASGSMVLKVVRGNFLGTLELRRHRCLHASILEPVLWTGCQGSLVIL
jgi:hypothetical protein